MIRKHGGKGLQKYVREDIKPKIERIKKGKKEG